MSLELQSRLAGYLVWLPLVLFGVGAIWAMLALSRPPRRDRPDRGKAIRLGVAIGLVAGVGFAIFAGMFAMGFGGSFIEGFGIGLAYGLGIGLVLLVSGLVGYAVLARPRIGSIALVGVIAGPLALGGATVALNKVREVADARWNFERSAPERAAAEAENARAEAAAVERASHLTVTVIDSSITTSPFDASSSGRGTITVISSIKLVIAVHTDVRITLTEPKTLGGPVFSIRPAADPSDPGLFEDLFDVDLSLWPAVLEAGSTTRYSIEFAYDTSSKVPEKGANGESLQPGEPGTWVLQTILVDERQDYWVKETSLTLAP